MITKEELKRLQEVKTSLENKRDSTKKALWEEVISFCLPELDPDGNRRKHYSDAAISYTDKAATALQGWAYGRSISWLTLALEDGSFDDDKEVKEWLQRCEDVILKDLSKSSFYDESVALTKIVFNLSTGIMIIDWDEARQEFIFESLNPMNVVLQRDKSHRINALMYDFSMDKDSAESEFGDKCPEKIKNSKDYTTIWNFTKAIVSSKRFDISVPGDGEWIEVIWAECDKKTALSERRLNVCPFVVWPWARSLNNSDWGAGSPGEVMIATINELNSMHKSNMKAMQLRNEPPIKATEGLAVNIRPSGITYLKGNQDFSYAPPPGSSVEIMNQEQILDAKLRQAYNVDFFLMMQQAMENNKTATEASLLSDEKAQFMSAFTSQMTKSFLEPVLEAVFDIELRHQRLPKPPEAIQGKELRIDYVSPLSIAQKKAQRITPALQFMNQMFQYAELFPSLKHKFKLTEYADYIANELNIDTRFLNTEEEVQRLMDEESKAMQEQLNIQNQLQQAQAQAKAYQAFSKAPEAGSPAERMTGGANG